MCWSNQILKLFAVKMFKLSEPFQYQPGYNPISSMSDTSFSLCLRKERIDKYPHFSNFVKRFNMKKLDEKYLLQIEYSNNDGL